MLTVFSGGQSDHNHVGQLATNLSESKHLDNLQEVFFLDSNHTYTITRHRRHLIDTIKNWMETVAVPLQKSKY